jgi:arylsulfatase A-like enzyme
MKILLVDVDTLNPDHLGCYGYARPTSPNIDGLAQEGVLFERAYCSDSPCGPSRAALFSGRYGIANGVVTHLGRGTQLRDSQPFESGEQARREQPMLAELFNRHGLFPVTFSSFAERHRFWWFTAGWAQVHNRMPGACGQETADQVNAAVLPWLREHADQDWFLHVHYWDPHRNYRCPEEWVDRIRGFPAPAWPDQATIDRHWHDHSGPFTPFGLYPWGRTPLMPEQLRSRADFEHFVDGYDASIRFCDHHIGALFQTLRDAGVWEEVLVILTSDHGEQMGGDGVYGDHTSTHEQTQRVPLVVRLPEKFGGLRIPVAAGSRCPGLVLGLDLTPTLAELAGLAVPAGWQGRSLVPQLVEPMAPTRDHVVLTHGLYTAQRAVNDGVWKLVRTYHPGLFGLAPIRLFHLLDDPHETWDRSAEQPRVVARLQSLLEDFVQGHLAQTGEPDPLTWIIEDGPFKHVGLSEWNARLRAAGRLEIDGRAW